MNHLFAGILLLAACSPREEAAREAALKERQDSLDRREQNLLLRERSVDLREEALAGRSFTADSTRGADSAQLLQPSLTGSWAVQMSCVETTCPGSAVGDTKTEDWHFAYQGSSLQVRATAGGELVRVYTGTQAGNTVELLGGAGAVAQAPGTQMLVRLRITDSLHLEGQREILRASDCKVVYDLKLQKQAL
ncbi:MAG: hypothetical protein EOO11_03615 [Chitinophagaceae bacterium]|nr:MAG: hypothetical protein EOO11_03615 [Chitinophagaceae bacterium]